MRILQIPSGRLRFKTKLIIGMVLLLMVAAGTLMALLAIGMVLFMLPVIVVAALVYTLLPKRRTHAPRRADEPGVLEGQFRVVDRPPAERTGSGRLPGE